MRLFHFTFLLLSLIIPLSAKAVMPDEILKDQKLEQRARNISADLRCLVCQNQSIDDSDAPLARDIRLLVRERVQQGETDEAIKDFMVKRYGTYVLLRPPFNATTLLLWLAPLLILTLASLKLYKSTKLKTNLQKPLTPEEQAKVEAILKQQSTT